MIQDFSGKSFHYVGIRREESLVGGTVMWNNFKRTAALNGELNEQAPNAPRLVGSICI